ncbi:transposase [Methanosarcina spelaei]|uniref:transposase n=1 Tax=Methanosarcina spelaei TaxID=1036679 RepID=UPI001140DD68
MGYDGHKKIKGIKISVLVDLQGLNLSIIIVPTNKNDSTLYIPTLKNFNLKRFEDITPNTINEFYTEPYFWVTTYLQLI